MSSLEMFKRLEISNSATIEVRIATHDRTILMEIHYVKAIHHRFLRLLPNICSYSKRVKEQIIQKYK